jgi:hypothetical protein
MTERDKPALMVPLSPMEELAIAIRRQLDARCFSAVSRGLRIEAVTNILADLVSEDRNASVHEVAARLAGLIEWETF